MGMALLPSCALAKKQKPFYSIDSFTITGALMDRKIVHMELLAMPPDLEISGPADVSYVINANPQGEVTGEIVLEKSSGNTALDAAAKEALGKFRFTPLSPGETQSNQSGTATWRFVTHR